MSSKEGMDVDVVLDGLSTALSLQYRSVLELTTVSAMLTGPSWFGIAVELRAFAVDGLDDARHLAEKMTALGGDLAADSAEISMPTDPMKALGQLVEHEIEALTALHAVIADTGQEPRSEALEHRLEHIIMRKQEQVDTMVRVLGPSG